MNNLIDNTINHAYDKNGGKVRINIYLKEADYIMAYTEFPKGIPEDKIGSIFDPFVTSKGLSGEGTGLGLNILFNLVAQKLDGRIWCESTVDKQTTFFIQAPTFMVQE